MAEIAKAFPVANFRVLMELFPLLNSDLDRFGSVVLDHPALTVCWREGGKEIFNFLYLF